jgi:signal transduction histidine kinase
MRRTAVAVDEGSTVRLGGRTEAAPAPEWQAGHEFLLSLVTHELLHPVATLRALAANLSGHWDELDETARLDLVHRIDKETGRLRDLTEQTATMGMLHLDGFFVAPRAESVVELIREANDATWQLGGRLRVRMGEGAEKVEVSADRDRILQVLRNLLSNAEKYSEPDSLVELRVQISNDGVVFTVTDQGEQIPPEHVPMLFQPYSRLPSGIQGVRGMGLGLYISQRIVAAHGGKIWVENEAEGTVSFSFELPYWGQVS